MYNPREAAKTKYTQALTAARSAGCLNEVMRKLCRTDLFFLMLHILDRKDIDHDWLYARCMDVQNNPDGYLDLWARFHWKAVDVNEPVPTPNGWKKHGDLVPGDFVFSPDGQPIEVVAKTPVFYDAKCMRVTFSDEYSVVVSDNHLWTVDLHNRSRINGNRRKKRKRETITTSELKEEVEKSSRIKSRVMPKIDIPQPVCYGYKDLPLDPYVFGVWLGDGSRGTPNVTSSFDDSNEMKRNIERCGVKVGIRKHSNSVTLHLGNGIQGKKGTSEINNALRSLGVLRSKRIPRIYLESSPEQRFSLLQGLMDTDGTIHKKHGQCTFCSASQKLAENVFELCCSLGLKPTKRKYQYKKIGKLYKFWHVSFQGRNSHIPFRLKRKRNLCVERNYEQPYRAVCSVEECETIPVSCIQVNSDDGQYLIGKHFVPTHNSSAITQAKTVQDILINPESTFCILSYNRPLAKGFLFQIRQELQNNNKLKFLFPDILYENPKRDSPKWSLDSGIVVQRKNNPKEATVEAWGLVDSQPIGRHYSHLVYDDVVTADSVTTPEMITKVTTAWELSRSLVKEDGSTATRYIGTRYHFGDTYKTIMDRGAAIPRIHPATKDGTLYGEPVLLSREMLDQLRREMGQYTFSSQMLLNPVADTSQGFKYDWLRYWEVKDIHKLNIYLLVDPASSKKKNSDYTAMLVFGLGEDGNIYIIDMVYDKLSLTERANMLFRLRKKYRPLKVGYEKYGMQSDIEHFEDRMNRENYRFSITALPGKSNWSIAKPDRIKSLVPLFENHRIYLPEKLMRTNYEGKLQDLVQIFVDQEYLGFPVAIHDDMLDCMARVNDPDFTMEWPDGGRHNAEVQELINQAIQDSSSWMAM